MRRTGALLVCALLLQVRPTVGQTIPTQYLDGRALALGGALALRAGDARAIWWNPAALLSPDSSWSVALGAARPFGLADLTSAGLAVARTRPRHGLGIGVATFGDDAYRETVMSFGAGVRFTSSLRAGASVHLTDVAISGYERSTMLAVSCGILVPVSKRVTASFLGASLMTWSWGELLLTAARKYDASIEYAATDEVRLSGIVTREDGNRWSSGVALAVEPHPWLSLYLGRTGGPSGFTSGCEIRTRFVHFSYGVRFHPDLDPTHAATVTLVGK